ncbi:MAG: hypothetical protein HC904_09430 [Blastochloris sp.]|nr:hypothetical protein [Blastochloris sp.]
MGSTGYSTNETAGTVAVAVVRKGSLDSEVTVDYATADVTATDGTDYTSTTGTLTFAVGESTKTVNVPILNEDDEEPIETFTFTLDNPTGGGPDPEDAAVLGTEIVSTISIAANDASLVRFQDVVYTMFEGQIVANVVVERIRNIDNWGFVHFNWEDGTAKAGDDYSIVGRKAIFLPGQAQTLIPMQLISDAVVEGVENFKLHLSSPSGGLDQSVVGGQTTDIDLSD